MPISYLDVAVVDGIEELQDQSLSSYVEDSGCIHGATKPFKTDQFKKMLSSIFIVKLELISYKDLAASSSMVSMTSVTASKLSLF